MKAKCRLVAHQCRFSVQCVFTGSLFRVQLSFKWSLLAIGVEWRLFRRKKKKVFSENVYIVFKHLTHAQPTQVSISVGFSCLKDQKSIRQQLCESGLTSETTTTKWKITKRVWGIIILIWWQISINRLRRKWHINRNASAECWFRGGLHQNRLIIS